MIEFNIREFSPWTTWEGVGPSKHEEAVYKFIGDRWILHAETLYIKDLATNQIYRNTRPHILRLQCLALVGITPSLKVIFSIVDIAFKMLRILSFSHFWKRREGRFSVQADYQGCIQDLFSIILTPIALAGMQLSAIYGVYNPLEGRKLYASLERVLRPDCFYIMPSFQPIEITL